MPNKSNIMIEQAINILKEKFGTEFGVDAVKEVADELNTTYATLSKYLNEYKVGRGKWNLEQTVQDLEETYNSPAAEGSDTVPGVATMNSVAQISSLIKMLPSSALVTFRILRKLFSLVYSILLSSLVFLATEKLSVWNSLVPNLVGN